MKIRVPILATITVLLGLLGLMTQGQVLAQQPASNTSPTTVKESSAKQESQKQSDEHGTAGAQASPQVPPETVWTRSKLTGEWGGARKKWEDHGISIDIGLTQYYQGTAAGGLEQNDAYGGNVELRFKFDLGKLGLWKNGLIDAKSETRYGTSANSFTGALVPVNTGLLNPAEKGTVIALTTLTYTHVLPLEKPGDLIILSGGKFDTFDLVSDAFLGGAGLSKFMNLSQNAPTVMVRNVPPVSIGGIVAWVRGGEAFLSLAVLDSKDSSTTVGLSDLFQKGVTVMPAITLPSRFFGKAGHHTLTFSYSNQSATPFDQLRQVILPDPSRPVQPQHGTTFVVYSFDQYFSEIPGPRRKGWGLFGQLGFADRRTAPFQTFVNIGIGGNSPFKKRPGDWFGVAYAFNSVSGDLKGALDPIVRLGNEHAFEAFYNFALTPWLFLTGDLQVVAPARPRPDTVVVPGLRMRIIF